MLSNVISYWQFGTTYCSVELTNFDKKEKFFSVCAGKKNEEFVDFKYAESSSIKELSNKLSKNQHLYLTINTDKVLIRDLPDTENNNNILSKAFPGLNFSEFYYNVLTTDKKSFVSVCRKDYVHNLIDSLNKEKIEVIGFELGFATLSNVIPSLDEKSIQTNKYRFTLENQQIFTFDQVTADSNTLYKIDSIEVSSKYILALSGLIKYVSESQQLRSNYTDTNDSLKQNQSHKNFFRKGVVVILGVLLVSLLINAVVFSNYYKKQQLLQEEFQMIKSQQDAFLLRKNEVESKEKLAENILNNENSKSSFYINRIIAQKPNSIIFNEIEFQPLEKAIRADKKIEYISNEMVVKGLSSSKTDFTSWIETLESEIWLESTLVKNYAYFSQTNSTFELRLILKQDVSKK